MALGEDGWVMGDAAPGEAMADGDGEGLRDMVESRDVHEDLFQAGLGCDGGSAEASGVVKPNSVHSRSLLANLAYERSTE